MRTLAFRRPLVDAILDGRKRATVRHSTRLKAGDEVGFTWRRFEPPFAVARVTDVSRFDVRDALNDPELYGVPPELADDAIWAEWSRDPDAVTIRFELVEVVRDPRPRGHAEGQLATG